MDDRWQNLNMYVINGEFIFGFITQTPYPNMCYMANLLRIRFFLFALELIFQIDLFEIPFLMVSCVAPCLYIDVMSSNTALQHLRSMKAL